MNTKFHVEIHASNPINEMILAMVANHNEGKTVINIEALTGYVLCRNAQFAPSVNVKFYRTGDGWLHLSEKNKLFLSLEEREIIGEVKDDITPLGVFKSALVSSLDGEDYLST